MKILVPTKRVPDPDQRIRVDSTGSGLDLADVPHIVNPFDANALEEAVQMREGPVADAEIVAIGIGDEGYAQELRAALALGADRALHVECDGPLDPWNVARILKSVVERESADLVLMGKQAVDDDANQTGQFLAALLDWPQATFASAIELLENKEARVARETDDGIETIRISLPAVITADLRLNEPRYASLPAIMKAKRKPIDALSLEELGVAMDPKVEVLSMEATSSERNCQIIGTVDELLGKLRDESNVL